MPSPKKKQVRIQESKQNENNHFDRSFDNRNNDTLSPRKKVPMSLSDRLSQSDHIKRIPNAASSNRSVSSELSPTKKKRLQLIKVDGLWKIVEVEKSPIKISKATVCRTPLELMPMPNLYDNDNTKKKDPIKKKSCNEVATLHIDSFAIKDASKALSLVKESGWSSRTIDSPVKIKKKKVIGSCSTISPRKNKAIVSLKDFDKNKNDNKEVSIGWSSHTVDSPVKIKKKVIGSCSTISPQKNKTILSSTDFDIKNRNKKDVSMVSKNATYPKLTPNEAENVTNGLNVKNEPTLQSPKKQITNSGKALSPTKQASKPKKTTTATATTATTTKSPVKIPIKSPLVTCEKVKINDSISQQQQRRRRRVTFTEHRVVYEVPRVETPLKKIVFYTREDIKQFREDQTKERYAEIERQFMEAFGSMMIPPSLPPLMATTK